MAPNRQVDDASVIRDAAERARALRESLARDGASVADYPDWPEGPALYEDTIAALDRVILELEAQAQPETVVTAQSPVNPPEGPRS